MADFAARVSFFSACLGEYDRFPFGTISINRHIPLGTNLMNHFTSSENRRTDGYCVALATAFLVAPAAIAIADGDVPVDTDILDRIPSVYVIPMEGQMGTDIHPAIYDDIIADVEKANPDIVIYRLESADIDNIHYRANDDAREAGKMMPDEYSQLLNDLHEKIDARQVMWVVDSVGISSLFALGWAEMYMGENARLYGMEMLDAMTNNWSDADVRSKMKNAWVSFGNGFLQKGGYPLELGFAMIRPEYTLSAKFKGRTVEWQNDTHGQWVVDSSDKHVARFTNETAEDTALSDGTASSLEDLIFLLGYREYEPLNSGSEMHTKYVEDWRRTFDRSREWWGDYEQKMGWASGEDAVKYMGSAKGSLEKIVRAMRAYPAVEVRWKADFGMTKLQLEIMIEQLKEQIAAMRNRGRNGRGGGSGRGGGGRGGGGGLGG